MKTRVKEPVLSWGFDDADESEDWEMLCDELSGLISFNEDKTWYGTVSNFGWRNQDGEARFNAENGQELLRHILPETDCCFKIYIEGTEDDTVINIQNYHHDSPVGNEWYEVLPAKACIYCGDILKKEEQHKDKEGNILCEYHKDETMAEA
ncbi:hypothetical protein GF336_00700 [Candidatus Woesearchaeota archaeon]|nr:hypothetical protein [Candidatus Woesearchaeota archaeon]